MTVEPEVRASLLRLCLGQAEALLGADADAIREALGPEAIRRIGRARGGDWLPIRWEAAIDACVLGRMGPEAVRRLGRSVGRAAIEDTGLRPLVAALLGMLGRRPDTLLRLTLAGWTRATRNAGEGTLVETGGGRARIGLGGVPEEARAPALLLRICGSVEAVFGYGRVAARAVVEGAPGRETILVTWGSGPPGA